MGFMTLLDFRTEIDAVLGSRVFVTARLTTWVNLGYYDVTGAIDFHELDIRDSFDTSVSDYDYSLPSGMREVLALYDADAKYGIREVNIAEFNRQDRSVTGPPKTWARHGDLLYLYPTPIDVREIDVYGRIDPEPLSVDGDVTLLSGVWDAPILMFAISHGLLSLNEDARAVVWYNRGVAYMQTRVQAGKLNLPPSPGGQ
jgi:hypothetical protein